MDHLTLHLLTSEAVRSYKKETIMDYFIRKVEEAIKSQTVNPQ
jgi:hypothetical protein